MFTLEEVKERLKERVDEVSLVEYLGITAEDLVDRFEDIIENDLPKFRKIVDDTEEGHDDDSGE